MNTVALVVEHVGSTTVPGLAARLWAQDSGVNWAHANVEPVSRPIRNQEAKASVPQLA